MQTVPVFRLITGSSALLIYAASPHPENWGMRTLALTAAVLAAYALPGYLERVGESVYLPWILGEDGIYESLGTLACLAASILMAVLFFTTPKPASRDHPPRRNLFFAVFSLGLFLIFAEEINWGQRLLALVAPSWFFHLNDGGEMALHVLGSQLTPMITTAVLALGALVYLSVLPLVCKHSSRVRSFIERRDIPIASPPVAWAMAVLFFFALFGFERSQVGHFHSEQFEGPLQLLFLYHAIEVFRARTKAWSAKALWSTSLATSAVMLALGAWFAVDGRNNNRIPARYHFIWAMHCAGQGDFEKAEEKLNRVLARLLPFSDATHGHLASTKRGLLAKRLGGLQPAHGVQARRPRWTLYRSPTILC